MSGRWDASGGDHGFPLERPSAADHREMDPDPIEADRFDPAEEALAQWPWSGSLPRGDV